MRSPSRRFGAVTALGVVAALGLALAPAPDATRTALAGAVDFTPQLVTVDTPTRAHKAQLTSMGLDLTEHAGHDYVEVVLHTPTDEALLRDGGFTWDVRIPDMLARELERIALDETFAEANPATGLPSGRNSYRVLGDFLTEMDQLAAEHPEIAERISIGTSVEGRELAGIEIGQGVNDPEDGRPVFLMFGAHHAREWPSAELPMEFAHELVQGYVAGDERIVDLLSRGRAIIVPVSNPDGYDASRTSGDIVDLRAADNGGIVSILGTPGNAYKRKNCRYVDGQTQPAGTCAAVPSPGGFGVGIDLNRNYGALWGGPGTSDNHTSAVYRGPAPFSEPETQAIRDLISTRQVTTLITNHTFSNLILRPVGVQPATIAPDGYPIGFAPDECFTADDGRDLGMQTVGERMAAQTGYSNQFGWELYDTTGTTEDYSYNATGGYGYTFEIGPNEFHPPFEQVVAEYTGNTAAAKKVVTDGTDHLTTEAGDECEGHPHEHETVAGGNREAFLVAFENALDAATHSVITGSAPAGATLSLERAGVFPLWDGTLLGDVVATSMQVGEDGTFEYHANPSTRPFVQSRKAPVLGDPKDSFSESGTALAQGSASDHTFTVSEPADILRATVRAAYPVDGQVVRYRQFTLDLIDEGNNVVASANDFGPVNALAWTGPEGGNGVPAGTYTLRVRNAIAPLPEYDIEAVTQDVLADQTPRLFEQWTLTCITADGIAEQSPVTVERGDTIDVGNACGPDDTTDTGTGKGKKPAKDRNPRAGGPTG